MTAGPLRFSAPVGLPDGPVMVGVRPEAIRLGHGRGIEGQGRVRLVENLGGELVVYLEAEGTALVVSFPVTAEAAPAFESATPFTIAPAEIQLFGASDGHRLRV